MESLLAQAAWLWVRAACSTLVVTAWSSCQTFAHTVYSRALTSCLSVFSRGTGLGSYKRDYEAPSLSSADQGQGPGPNLQHPVHPTPWLSSLFTCLAFLSCSTFAFRGVGSASCPHFLPSLLLPSSSCASLSLGLRRGFPLLFPVILK